MKSGATERTPPPKLSSKQASYLKGLAHSLDPVMRLGKAGLTEGALSELDGALKAHELIKVRLEKEANVEQADLRAAVEAMSASLVGQVGRVCILYRRHPKLPKIELPRTAKVSGQ